MAQPYVTGPAHLLLATGALDAEIPVSMADPAAGAVDASEHYLGTAEHTPRIVVAGKFIPIFISALSRVVPSDSAFAGEEGFIFADLTRWNEDVYQLAASRPSHSEGSKPGQWDVTEVGVLTNSQPALQLMVLFPYADKPAYAGMPRGYLFPHVESMGPDDLFSLGVNPRKTHVAFHALPKLEGKTWTLYKLL
jgi:hypothetical protein